MNFTLHKRNRASGFFRGIFLMLAMLLSMPAAYSQDLVLNEMMSDNDLTIEDGLGEFSDWIELYYKGDSAVNIGICYLSDDPMDLKKWKLPNLMIAPGDFKLVFASGKDTMVLPRYWNTLIDWGDEWKYRRGDEEPPTFWYLPGFYDGDWDSGPTGIGYGDGDDSTILVSPILSFYARKSFYIENLDQVDTAILDIDYDDGFVAYLNGVEIARENLDGVPPAHNKPAGPWLDVNGEAIYGTRTWDVFGEGPTRLPGGGHKIEEKAKIVYNAKDIRFTKKSDTELYAIVLDTPENDLDILCLSTYIGLLNTDIKKVELLGSDEKIEWTRDEKGLHIKSPSSYPTKHAHAYKISLQAYQEADIDGEI